MEEGKQKNEDLGEKEELDEEIREEEVVYAPGTKEDFVSLIHASYESDEWVRKYRDYDCFRKMLDHGKLHDMAARTKIGDYVGSCICLEFDSYAFVAAYYVHPKFRKKGIGTKLFSSVVTDSLRKKNIGLHAVQAMASIYDHKLGFSVKGDWQMDNFLMTNVDVSKISGTAKSLNVIDGRELSLSKVVDYDSKVHKSKRGSFVSCWAVDRIDGVCKVLVNGAGEVIGYGCGRLLSLVACPAFGPVYCDSDEGFLLLFKTLVECFDETLKEKNAIVLRIPSTMSGRVLQLLDNVGTFEKKPFCQLLFTKSIPEHDISKVYCASELTLFI